MWKQQHQSLSEKYVFSAERALGRDIVNGI